MATQYEQTTLAYDNDGVTVDKYEERKNER